MKTNETENDKYCLGLPGKLTIENVSSLYEEIKKMENIHPLPSIEIDFKELREFDSSAIALFHYMKRIHTNAVFNNVSPEFEKLFAIFPLAQVSKEKIRETRKARYKKRVEAFADKFLSGIKKLTDFLMLVTDEIYHTVKYLVNRRGIYPGEISNQVFTMAYKSYPIVATISFLVGITISITSAQQLRNFGADIYLADLIGFGMIRELVPMMSGIILAGKIGASITAEIASMKVMEETDALKTMGIIPEKFLMVPRLIAITLAIPLLVAVADFVGIGAGILIAQRFSDIPPNLFLKEMFSIVDINDFLIGLMKTVVFGWIIVLGSGYKGFSVKHGASGVGIVTTESVVLSISMIIVFDCIFAFILY